MNTPTRSTPFFCTVSRASAWAKVAVAAKGTAKAEATKRRRARRERRVVMMVALSRKVGEREIWIHSRDSLARFTCAIHLRYRLGIPERNLSVRNVRVKAL